VKRASVILVIFAAALVFAASALAGGSAVLSGHSSTPNASATLGVQTPKTTKAKTKPSATAPTIKSSSPTTLPFTGTDLAFAALAGIVLVGAGAALRRSSRQSS
jgi:hypothetical protein